MQEPRKRTRQRKPSLSAAHARRSVGNRLYEIRREADLTMLRLAEMCGWHEAKISRIENAHTPPSPADIRIWCENCAAPGEAEGLIESLRTAEELLVGWPSMESSGLARAQHSVLPVWECTREFRAYSSWILPGAVQISDYTHAALKSLAARRNLPDDTAEAASARADRQRLLLQGGRKFTVIIEERVLRTEIGSPKIMGAQLSHILTLMTHPAFNITLSIIPHCANRSSMWPAEDFWIFDQKQVNVELISGWLTHDQDTEIAMYEKAFHDLSELAVQGVQARTLVTAAMDALPS